MFAIWIRAREGQLKALIFLCFCGIEGAIECRLFPAMRSSWWDPSTYRRACGCFSITCILSSERNIATCGRCGCPATLPKDRAIGFWWNLVKFTYWTQEFRLIWGWSDKECTFCHLKLLRVGRAVYRMELKVENICLPCGRYESIAHIAVCLRIKMLGRVRCVLRCCIFGYIQAIVCWSQTTNSHWRYISQTLPPARRCGACTLKLWKSSAIFSHCIHRYSSCMQQKQSLLFGWCWITIGTRVNAIDSWWFWSI